MNVELIIFFSQSVKLSSIICLWRAPCASSARLGHIGTSENES